jgi:hypothetical protein
MQLDWLPNWAWTELPYGWLAIGALVILWSNTLLVVLAAARPVRQLLDYRSRFASGGCGEVIEGDPIACHVIAQTGRRASDDSERRGILFHDAAHHSRFAGGSISAEGGGLTRFDGLPDDSLEVWIDELRWRDIVAELQTTGFDEAYAAACKARGFRRDITCPLGVGDRVWFSALDDPDRALVASFDPLPWCRARLLEAAGWLTLMLALLAGITVLLFWPPIFGAVSTAGGGIAIVYFLLVQPAGVMLRDALAPPSRTMLRGSWVQAGSEGLGDQGATDDPAAAGSLQQRTPVE